MVGVYGCARITHNATEHFFNHNREDFGCNRPMFQWCLLCSELADLSLKCQHLAALEISFIEKHFFHYIRSYPISSKMFLPVSAFEFGLYQILSRKMCHINIIVVGQASSGPSYCTSGKVLYRTSILQKTEQTNRRKLLFLATKLNTVYLLCRSRGIILICIFCIYCFSIHA